MTFTYTPGSATAKDDVRFALGDTDSSAPASLRLEDEEITRLLTLYGTTASATLVAAEALLAKVGRTLSEKTVGNLSLKWGSRLSGLQDLVERLRQRVATSAAPYGGGISQGEKNTIEEDSDRRQPAFVSGMLDNPEADNQFPVDPANAATNQ